MDDLATDDGAQSPRRSLLEVRQQRGAGAGVSGPGLDQVAVPAHGQVPGLPDHEGRRQAGAQGSGVTMAGHPLPAAAGGEEGGAVADALAWPSLLSGGPDPAPGVGGLGPSRRAEGQRRARGHQVQVVGPDSEIFYDRGPEADPDGGPATDFDRYMELWNLVFMQYLRGEGVGKDYPILGELENKNIDTGMGLERVAYLLQGVDNIYEIDQVYPVIDRAADMAGVRYGSNFEHDVRLRVVADHVRSAMMIINDGVNPGNEGRGYVVRRLLRRSVRAMRLLGVEDASLPELLPVSRDAMSPV